jgi:hypothetical protein
MPPVGAPRPDRATYDGLLTLIEQAWFEQTRTANNIDAKTTAAPGSQEIGMRLATLLWNSAPDASLLDDAHRSDPVTLEREIHRMIADDRREAFVSRFFFPWL